jgi:hypothetical protein
MHDFEKLQTLQTSLNGYVHNLHKKQPNLQMSAYEVLCDLIRLESVPSVPVGLANIGELAPQRMQELENLVGQLSGAWQVVEEKDFPWLGYSGNSYSLEVRSELNTFLGTLISHLSALRLEAIEFSKRLGLEAPETIAKVDWLTELSRLLMESPKPEPNWVTHLDIYELIREAKAHQALFEWRKAERNRLLNTYTESIFYLNINKSNEIDQTLTAAKPLLVQASVEDGDLLKNSNSLNS